MSTQMYRYSVSFCKGQATSGHMQRRDLVLWYAKA